MKWDRSAGRRAIGLFAIVVSAILVAVAIMFFLNLGPFEPSPEKDRPWQERQTVQEEKGAVVKACSYFSGNKVPSRDKSGELAGFSYGYIESQWSDIAESIGNWVQKPGEDSITQVRRSCAKGLR